MSARSTQVIACFSTLASMETTPRESSVSLATLIAALPPEERAILTLHYVLGHSVDEIAATLADFHAGVSALHTLSSQLKVLVD